MKVLRIIVPISFILFAAACCKEENQNNNNNNNVSPPNEIVIDRLVLNNVNTSNPSQYHFFTISFYSGNVLLTTSTPVDLSIGQMPATIRFNNQPTFSYNFRDYEIRFLNNYGAGDVQLGSIMLSLSDYSQDTYPKPAELFFNIDGFAGTIYLAYQ